jgi:ubiquinone/menaquinone biosynthesis C-methylase UbiE
MTFWAAIGRQLCEPSGTAGSMMGRLMSLLNARPYALAVAALDLEPTNEILELGCGPGQGIRLMAARVPRGVVHAVDHSPTMLSQAYVRNRRAVRLGRARLYRSRWEQLPLPDHSIDRLLAVNVAYFWHDAAAVLREARRVLRPGGLMSVYVTDASSMRRWPFADPQTHRLFDRDALAGLLRNGGFANETIAVSRVEILPGVTGLVATAGRPSGSALRRPRAPPA